MFKEQKNVNGLQSGYIPLICAAVHIVAVSIITTTYTIVVIPGLTLSIKLGPPGA